MLWSVIPLLCLALSLAPQAQIPTQNVQFPGPNPGRATAIKSKGIVGLQNNVIRAEWQVEDRVVSLAQIENRLTGQRFNQSGNRLFRISTVAPKVIPGIFVGIRWDSGQVLAVASHDGRHWSTVSSFPRSKFPGEPNLIRLGKMNLKGEGVDNPDLGSPGHYQISELNFSPLSIIMQEARAHQAAIKEFQIPAGSHFVSCRIEKQTDQGMSWGPALSIRWPNSNRFVLIGDREADHVLNVTTPESEQILNPALPSLSPMNLSSDSFRCISAPTIHKIVPDPKGIRITERFAGQAIEATFASSLGLQIRWHAELRDGSNAIRQTYQILSSKGSTPIFGLQFLEANLPQAAQIGTVPGCPVAANGLFLGTEVPGTSNFIEGALVRQEVSCQLNVTPSQSYQFGTVIGVYPEGQMRRAFLAMMERERARPSKPFLHYNCWYDLGFGVDAAQMIDAAKQFHQELEVKRGVHVQSYLVDDGWDDVDRGLWSENQSKFPTGLPGLGQELGKQNGHLAVWISPLGGYGGAEERTRDARKLGIIPADGQLDLSYPGYKNWFQNRCLTLMRESGVNAFKWDRAGDGVTPHFMALLDVAHRLRQQDSNVFINVTVGTWPSPFWLNHVDSTWRNGSADVGWAGVGDMREKWLTFRDGYCKRMFVDRSPLYPLNSVMHHGIVHGRNFQGEPIGKTGPYLRNEARSYFANGTSLQELYITPSMMDTQAWDDVAEAAKWAQRNADVLVDSHWVGGDPLKLEPYGYASWNPRHGTLMVRNPSDKPSTIDLEAGSVFELPDGAPKIYALKSPYKNQLLQSLRLVAGRAVRVTLQPFEVLVFDSLPN